MASLPLVGVKPCPRRRLIRAEEWQRGGAADTPNSGRGARGREGGRRRGGRGGGGAGTQMAEGLTLVLSLRGPF